MAVFNGEIYNHQELRRRLEQKGHSFQSRSDSGILPAMYLQHGTDMVDHLNGMFAIALWDFRKKCCFLWRDRFGQKPLYTAVHRNVFYFASEIKALLALPRFPRKFDVEAMRQYLFLGQILCPRTPFHGIRSLPPAHVQRITSDTTSTSAAYWDISIPEDEANNSKLNLEEYKAEFDARIQRSVKRRLQSDVPLAATLSGGLDSSSVLYYASELTPESTEAFCITFESDEWQADELNEAEYQEDVIRKLRVPTHRLNFFEKEEEIANEIDNAYWTYEFPDSVVQQEIVFTLLAREMYRNGFKVGLGGEGADEMMQGYEWYEPQFAYLQALSRNGSQNGNGLSSKAIHMLREEEWFVNRFGFPSVLFQEQLEWRRIDRLFQEGTLPDPFTDQIIGPEQTDFTNQVSTEQFAQLSGKALLQYADIKLRL
ncbi:MAG: asparagine synthase (glutamine-hydrolyzing), partial [Planctomycetota bacterium]|nr:asparagine synthase (glutamine-hydrolyzing) [Planctomycetota bacterium]